LRKTVEAGRTLLVDGPAAVTVLSGKAEVFGFVVGASRRTIIRESKRLPFTVTETASFDIALGAGAGVDEMPDSTIPHSWAEAYETARQLERKPVVAAVVGGVDAAKSSFCTYLTNRLVSGKCRVTILDEDLGQSDIGPPTTVAYAHVTKPITDLFSLKPQNTVFVGTTSPKGDPDRTVEAAVRLKAEILAKEASDYVVVNTDGWATEEAFQFKSQLLSALEPDVVFCLQSQDVPAPSLCAALGDVLPSAVQERVESPGKVRERNRESRRSLRGLGFTKYLENARVQVFPLSQLRVEGKDSYALIWVPQAVDNLLVAFHDGQKRFLGIGVIRAVDCNRRALKIFTAVAEKPASVAFGKVKLDRNLREIPEKP
jgi:polynucleotide 5'-hydroxyl-kinase GRC3/NOL9